MCYMLAERYGEWIRCFTLALQKQQNNKLRRSIETQVSDRNCHPFKTSSFVTQSKLERLSLATFYPGEPIHP
jgi:hypothetical protein